MLGGLYRALQMCSGNGCILGKDRWLPKRQWLNYVASLGLKGAAGGEGPLSINVNRSEQEDEWQSCAGCQL